MRNWCNVFDQVDFKASCLQGTNRCFTTSARTFNHYFHRFHTVLHSRFGSCFSSHLRSERGRLTGAFKSKAAGACPRNRVSVRIRNRYDRIVERGTDMSHATFNIFAVTTFSTYDFFGLAIVCYPPFLFLLVRYGTTRTFACTSIGFCTLSTNRQAATVTNTAVAANLRKTFNI